MPTCRARRTRTGRSISARSSGSRAAARWIRSSATGSTRADLYNFAGRKLPIAPRAFPFFEQVAAHTPRREGSLIFPPTDVARGDASDELRYQEPSAQPPIRMKAIVRLPYLAESSTMLNAALLVVAMVPGAYDPIFHAAF